jgi:CheY-like chemotaxis protein
LAKRAYSHPCHDPFPQASQSEGGIAPPRYRVPIIGLTGNCRNGDESKCLAAGMDEYLEKPATIEELVQKLVKWTYSVRLNNSDDDNSAGDTTQRSFILSDYLKMCSAAHPGPSESEIDKADDALERTILSAVQGVLDECCTNTVSVDVVTALDDFFGNYVTFTEIFFHYGMDLKPHWERLQKAFEAEDSVTLRSEAHRSAQSGAAFHFIAFDSLHACDSLLLV